MCIQADLHILDMTRAHIEGWIGLNRPGRKPSTINTRLVPICGFYRWAHQEGHIGIDPAAYVRRPRSPRRSNLRWFPAEQAAAILDAAEHTTPTMHALVCMLLLNGLRLTETITARIEHLGRQGDRTTLLLPSRKGGVMDRVSLPARTVTAINTVTEGRTRGLILQSTTGTPLTPASMYAQLDHIATMVNLDHPIRPHMLRATFITLSLDAGIPPRDILASTGHASSTMLDYYDRGYAAVERNASHRLAAHILKDDS